MVRRIFLFITLIMVLISGGCLKETYDMSTLSKKIFLSPTMSLSALKGEMSLSDIVKSNDTVVFDENNFIKLIFKKDSIVNLKLEDLYDFDNMVSFSNFFQLGDLTISPFQTIVLYSLNQIRTKLGEPYYTTFGSLNGTTAILPQFPSINLGNLTFPEISNLEYAVFRSGYVVISLTNNLTAPLKPIKIRLFNTSDNSPVGNEITIPTIPVGQTKSDSVNLANLTVRKSVYAAVILGGSETTSTAYPINLNNNNIKITIKGNRMLVKSGRIILPPNTLISSNGTKNITLTPGNGIEIDKIKITTGNLSYRIQKPSGLNGNLTISTPTIARDGSPVSKVITMGSGTIIDNSISLNNTIADLASVPAQPFNNLPYDISISSTGMIDFLSTDMIKIDLKFINPQFDYLKGYFGQEDKIIESDIFDLGIADFLSHITGAFHISNPTIKIGYKNSFAIPVKINLDASGIRNSDTVMLGLAPFALPYPSSPPSERDIYTSQLINKDNTNLPELISMPPEKIQFSGSACMNPAGDPNHLRNNYVFGNSRLRGDIEIEVPLEFRVNLQFADTLDNFLGEMFDDESDFNWDDFELFRIDVNVDNGFPIGLSLQMVLYDSLSTPKNLSSISATDILKPAPVDGSGKVNGSTESIASLTFTKEFFKSIKKAGNIILIFKCNSTGDNLKDIKMYSDYRIAFKASLIVKPAINLN